MFSRRAKKKKKKKTRTSSFSFVSYFYLFIYLFFYQTRFASHVTSCRTWRPRISLMCCDLGVFLSSSCLPRRPNNFDPLWLTAVHLGWWLTMSCFLLRFNQLPWRPLSEPPSSTFGRAVPSVWRASSKDLELFRLGFSFGSTTPSRVSLLILFFAFCFVFDNDHKKRDKVDMAVLFVVVTVVI